MGVINLGAIVERLKKAMSGTFVKNTDYATSSKGGVIKTSTTYCTDITSQGLLKGKAITAEAYESANDSAFVCKGTLDAVLAGSGGGVTMTLAYDSSEAAYGNNNNLSAKISGHKFLFIETIVTPSGSNILMESIMIPIGDIVCKTAADQTDFTVLWQPVFTTTEFASWYIDSTQSTDYDVLKVKGSSSRVSVKKVYFID